MKKSEEIRLKIADLEKEYQKAIEEEFEKAQRDKMLSQIQEQIEHLKIALAKASNKIDKYELSFNLALFEKIYKTTSGKENIDKWIEKIYRHLTDCEKSILKFRMIDELTLEEISAKFDMTRENVRQIEMKAILKMSKSIVASIETEHPKIDRIVLTCSKETTIEDMNLSVRLYNVLKRNNIRTIEDIINAIIDLRIFRSRNLGEKCLTELRNKLLFYGVDEKLLNWEKK